MLSMIKKSMKFTNSCITYTIYTYPSKNLSYIAIYGAPYLFIYELWPYMVNYDHIWSYTIVNDDNIDEKKIAETGTRSPDLRVVSLTR